MSQQGDFGRVASGLRWTLLGEVLFAAGQFGLLVVMARMGSDEALGRYALGLAIATPLFVLTSLHLRPAYVVAQEGVMHFGHVLGLRLLGAPLAVLLTAAWVYASGADHVTAAVVICVALTRLSEMISDVCHAAAARDEALHRVGISRALRGVLLLGSVAGAMALGASEVTALLVGAALGLSLTVLYDLDTARRHATVRPSFERSALWAMIRLTLPVGLAGGLLGLTSNTPAYVLEHSAGVEVLGEYAAIVSVLFISGVLNAAVGGAAVPRLARLFESDRRAFTALLLRVGGVVALAGAGLLGACVVAGDLYLTIAYGSRFVSLAPDLAISGSIALVAGVTNLLSQTVVAMKRFRLQLVLNAGFLAAAVLAGITLIPSRGLHGALIALGVVVAVRLVTYLVVVATLTSSAAPPKQA